MLLQQRKAIITFLSYEAGQTTLNMLLLYPEIKRTFSNEHKTENMR